MAKRYNILTRCLAALALLFVYVASTSAILVGATTSPAQAWRGGGRGWGGVAAAGVAAMAVAMAVAMVAAMASAASSFAADPVAGGTPTASASADTIDICVIGVT